MIYSYDKATGALCVFGMPVSFEQISALITTTQPAKSEVPCAQTVTEELSEDIEVQRAKFFSETQVNI